MKNAKNLVEKEKYFEKLNILTNNLKKFTIQRMRPLSKQFLLRAYLGKLQQKEGGGG